MISYDFKSTLQEHIMSLHLFKSTFMPCSFYACCLSIWARLDLKILVGQQLKRDQEVSRERGRAGDTCWEPFSLIMYDFMNDVFTVAFCHIFELVIQ